jgi:hypothetical protein
MSASRRDQQASCSASLLDWRLRNSLDMVNGNAIQREMVLKMLSEVAERRFYSARGVLVTSAPTSKAALRATRTKG